MSHIMYNYPAMLGHAAKPMAAASGATWLHTTCACPAGSTVAKNDRAAPVP